MATKKSVPRKNAKKAPAKKASKKITVTRRVIKKAPAKKGYTRKQAEALPVVNEEAAQPSNTEILTAIQVIDMRGLNTQDRFMILAMLNDQGYIAGTLDNLISNLDILASGLGSDVLHLQHQNKLVTFGDWYTAENSRFISAPYVTTQTKVGFNYPDSAHPAMMEIGGALYQRVM